MVFKGDMENIMTSPTMIINVDELEDGKSLDETLKAADAEPDMKSIPGVMIEGKDYRAFEMTENDVKGTILYAEEKGKIISVTIINSKPDDPDVLTILKNIKMKWMQQIDSFVILLSPMLQWLSFIFHNK